MVAITLFSSSNENDGGSIVLKVGTISAGLVRIIIDGTSDFDRPRSSIYSIMYLRSQDSLQGAFDLSNSIS